MNRSRAIRALLGGIAVPLVVAGGFASLYLFGLPLYVAGLVLLALALGRPWHAWLAQGTFLVAVLIAVTHGIEYREDPSTYLGVVTGAAIAAAVAAVCVLALRARR